MEYIGTALIPWSLAMTQATFVVALGAWVLDRVLRQRVSARFRLALYTAVFLRVLVPLDWTGSLGLLPDSSAWLLAAAALELPQTSIQAAGPGSGSLQAAHSPLAGASAAIPGAIVVPLYVVGVVLLGAIHLRGRLRLRRVLREATPLGERIDGVALYEHATAGPMATGLREPRIVLPRSLATLAPEARGLVIRHELAHHQHRDPLIVAALSFAMTLAWPLLPLWFARSRMLRLMEVAADARALPDPANAEARRQYGRLLATVDLTVTPRRFVGAPGMGYAALEERVRSLAHPPPVGSIPMRLGAVGLATLLWACAGAGQRSAPTPLAETSGATANTAEDDREDRSDNAESIIARDTRPPRGSTDEERVTGAEQAAAVAKAEVARMNAGARDATATGDGATQRFAREAEALERAERYADCGEKYLAAYNAAPAEVADAVETGERLILGAARCYERAGRVGNAIRLYKVVAERFPERAQDSASAVKRLFHVMLDADAGRASRHFKACATEHPAPATTAADEAARLRCILRGALAGAALEASTRARSRYPDDAEIEKLHAMAQSVMSRAQRAAAKAEN